MALQVYFDALTSVQETYTLQNASPFQNRLLFNSGAYFYFNSLLSNCLDVSLKGNTLFYLTRECLLNEDTSNTTKLPPPTELYTPIVYKGLYLTFKYDLSSSLNTSNIYTTFFSSTPAIWETFSIRFVNEKYCYIMYSDALGDFYLTINNNIGVMRRRTAFSDVFAPSGAQFFMYSLNGTNIVLFKNNYETGVLQQLIYNSTTHELSAANIHGVDRRTLLDFNFNIIDNRVFYNTKQNAGFVSYIDKSTLLLINREASTFDIPQNYLVYKNATGTAQQSDILSLKNFQTDRGQHTLGNNLALSSGRLSEEIKMRTYTSIFNNIDSDFETGLDLNYIKYNETIPINIGTTYFKTAETFDPFTQIKINDTTLARQGCFAGPTPILADRIYTLYPTLCTTNGKSISLLCTWLSGNINNSDSVWVDRYYYPDMALRNNISSTSETLDGNIVSEINTNTLLSSVIDSNHYFDTVSNMVFTPNTNYAYVRTDYTKISFSQYNDYYKIKDRQQYYKTINKNKGFLLSFDILNYQTLTPYDIFSQVSDVYGGIRIRFNRTSFYISLRLFSPRTRRYRVIESPVIDMPESTRIRVTINIDVLRGVFDTYIDHNRVMHRVFTPALYNTLLFGKLVTGGGSDVLSLNERFGKSTFKYNNVTNVFLSTRPFNDNLLQAFIVKRTRNNKEPFYISLPCGMKNETDSIQLVNLLQTSTRSKANAFNVNIANLNIDDEHKHNIYNIITDVSQRLPLNTEINKINIVS